MELSDIESFPTRSSEQSAACDKALAQIEEKGYARELLHEGYEKVVCYGMCFCDKYCMIKVAV